MSVFRKKRERDAERIAALEAVRRRYQAGKRALDQRIVEEERAWKLDLDDPGAICGNHTWNACVNKHADLMDSFPHPVLLPREASDEQEAAALSDIVPVILDRSGFADVYSEESWKKIKHGTGIFGVFWDASADHGLGDVSVRCLDLLNVFFDPDVSDIQDSEYLFICQLLRRESLIAEFPGKSIPAPSGSVDLMRYDDPHDTESKCLVVDCYYKKREGARTVLHFIKYTGDTLLYASEDDPALSERGFYDHGCYPVVLDVMYPLSGKATGYGLIAACRRQQQDICRLDQYLLDYAKKVSEPRWFIKKQRGLSREQFADWNEPFVEVEGELSEENVRQIHLDPMPSMVYSLLLRKVDELKETCGNRDVNSGETTRGVTSGAAISVLQEAGNKASRDIIRASYRAYTRVIYLVLELIRQFYDDERKFRIVRPDGHESYVRYSNQGMKDQAICDSFGQALTDDQGQAALRRPVFDIAIHAQKANPYSALSQNELATSLYSMGALDPANASMASLMLSMMDFEGKEELLAKISAAASAEETAEETYAPALGQQGLPAGF